MKLIFYLAYFTITFAQEYKTIFTAFFEGSNWEDLEWNISDKYGEKGENISSCGGEQVFGGYNVFGENSLASRKFILPPHYFVKIQVKFWKIDSWDGESFQLIADDYVYQKKFWVGDGEDLCGMIIFNDLAVMIEFPFAHYSQLLVLIMTSNLDEPADNESWAINRFALSILECFLGCLSCKDSTSACLIWSSLASSWLTQMSDDGWLINGVQTVGSSDCGGIKIAGGTFVLMQGQSLENTLKDLPFHFQIKFLFKIWALGDWEQENFELQVDNQVWMTAPINNINPINNMNLFDFNCGIKQRVSIVNTDTIHSHSSNEMKIVFKSEQSSQKTAFWGIQSLDIYIAKCSIGCQICFGAEPTMCITCIKKWGFYKNQCIPAPSIECGYIRTVQVKNQNINFPTSFHITIDQVNGNIIDEGYQKLFVSSSISNLTFQILVNCQENNKIDSFFRNCNQCQADKYQFLNNCSNENKALIYNAEFMQVVESVKELIIRVSKTRLEIVEVSLVNEVEQEVLIIKIDILKG